MDSRSRSCRESRGVAVLLAAATLLIVAGGARAQHRSGGYAFRLFWAAPEGDARSLVRGPRGRLWAGCGDGTVRVLEDRSGDGKADYVQTFASRVWSPHGISFRIRGTALDVFVAHTTTRYGGASRITRFVDTDKDDRFDEAYTVISHMPPGAHQTNNLAIDPTGKWLWFSQGATADKSPGGGALVGKVAPDARDVPWGDPRIQIVANGLRNAWGLAFHPNGALFATDNTRDDLGDATPPDELNLIRAGRHYGFPDVAGIPPKGHPSEPPVGLLGVHGSANGLAFDDGHLMSGSRHQVFIAEWGSWTGSPGLTAGTRIVRAQLHRDARGRWHFEAHDLIRNCGRPLDVAIGRDGALYFTVQTSAPGWTEGVWRGAPASGVTVRLEGQPRPGCKIEVAVRAPGHEGSRYRLSLRDEKTESSVRTGTLAGALGRATGTIQIPGDSVGRRLRVVCQVLHPETGAIVATAPELVVTVF